MTTYDRDRAELTAAARPLNFPDGGSYLMSPPTDKDISEVDHWVQQRFIDVGNRPGVDYGKLVAEAMTLSWMSPLGAKMMATIDGLAFICYVLCRHNHPDVTPAVFREHIRKAGEVGVREVNGVFARLVSNPKSESRQPKAARKKSNSTAPRSTEPSQKDTAGRRTRSRK
jgi:hypothetical protein